MASKNNAKLVNPAELLASKKARISEIDELLRKTAPSVTLIRESIEKDAGKVHNPRSLSELMSDVDNDTDQSASIVLFERLTDEVKRVREVRDSFLDEAVKAEIAKRQTSADAKKLDALKSERDTTGTEYDTLRSGLLMLLKSGIETPGVTSETMANYGELERAPRVTLSVGGKRGPRVKGFRMIYSINGETAADGNGNLYSASQVAFMCSQGINGTGTKWNVSEFIAFVNTKTGKNARTEDFEVTVTLKNGKTKKVIGKREDIPEDAPAATE